MINFLTHIFVIETNAAIFLKNIFIFETNTAHLELKACYAGCRSRPFPMQLHQKEKFGWSGKIAVNFEQIMGLEN